MIERVGMCCAVLCVCKYQYAQLFTKKKLKSVFSHRIILAWLRWRLALERCQSHDELTNLWGYGACCVREIRGAN